MKVPKLVSPPKREEQLTSVLYGRMVEEDTNESTNIVVYPEEPKKEDTNEVESIISEQLIKQELDTLVEQDNKIIRIVNYNEEELTRLFRSLSGLTPVQIRLIEIRYVNLIRLYEKRLFTVDMFYHVSRLIVSIGGVAVPALLSIQSPSGVNLVALYWFTWLVSLVVTVCHNISTLFRFDKKYFGIHSTLERLKTEGLQYLELSGHYSGHHGHVSPTHANQYVYFVNSIERIRQRQVEDEYSAARDTEKITPITNQQMKIVNQHEQVVPSPMDLTLNRGTEKNIRPK
jgi:AraC-like DNA-binding protein